MPRAKRLTLLEREAPELPLKTQAELLSLTRSSLYYQPVPVSADEIALKHAIDEIYTRYPFYGSRRVTVELRQNRQIKVARETVQRYMREMGIAGICPGPNLSRRHAAHKVYPSTTATQATALLALLWPQATAQGCKLGLWISGQLPKNSSCPLTHSLYYRIYPQADLQEQEGALPYERALPCLDKPIHLTSSVRICSTVAIRAPH